MPAAAAINHPLPTDELIGRELRRTGGVRIETGARTEGYSEERKGNFNDGVAI
uniref:Uncharacterized protein n=1 Tax=Arundo donax TaxID=35708 RepID=A0A0A9F0A3_ARUDO